MPKFMPRSLTPSQFANLCLHLNSRTLRASPRRSSSVIDTPVTSLADITMTTCTPCVHNGLQQLLKYVFSLFREITLVFVSKLSGIAT